MSKLEQGIWLAVAGYGLYSAGATFSTQANRVNKKGADLFNVLLLAGLGAAFLIRLDATADQARDFLA